jgi:hypothetical protein
MELARGEAGAREEHLEVLRVLRHPPRLSLCPSLLLSLSLSLSLSVSLALSLPEMSCLVCLSPPRLQSINLCPLSTVCPFSLSPAGFFRARFVRSLHWTLQLRWRRRSDATKYPSRFLTQWSSCGDVRL